MHDSIIIICHCIILQFCLADRYYYVFIIYIYIYYYYNYIDSHAYYAYIIHYIMAIIAICYYYKIIQFSVGPHVCIHMHDSSS